MSPEAVASVATLATLRREIAHDWSTASTVAADLAQFAEQLEHGSVDRITASHIALQLHHFYSAIETLLERVAAVVDQSVPRGDRAHQRLLEQAAADVPGLRSAVLSQETFEGLDALRKFRHFVRHAYAVDYDRHRLKGNVTILEVLVPRLRSDIERLDVFLAAALAAC